MTASSQDKLFAAPGVKRLKSFGDWTEGRADTLMGCPVPIYNPLPPVASHSASAITYCRCGSRGRSPRVAIRPSGVLPLGVDQLPCRTTAPG